MLDNIRPGSQIRVKVTKRPTNVAANKTLARVLAKSPTARAEQNRLEKVRVKQYSPRMRGGRLYSGRMVKIPPVKGTLGDEGVIIATVDVIKDLKSVARFIEVSDAK